VGLEQSQEREQEHEQAWASKSTEGTFQGKQTGTPGAGVQPGKRATILEEERFQSFSG